MLRRDSPTPREHMSERLWMRNRMMLLYSVCHHHEFVKTSHRGSHETCSPQVLTEPSDQEELRVSWVATVILGLVAIVLGILFEQQNIAFLAGLTLAVAASANFPVLLLAMYWPGLTTRGH